MSVASFGFQKLPEISCVPPLGGLHRVTLIKSPKLFTPSGKQGTTLLIGSEFDKSFSPIIFHEDQATSTGGSKYVRRLLLDALFLTFKQNKWQRN